MLVGMGCQVMTLAPCEPQHAIAWVVNPCVKQAGPRQRTYPTNKTHVSDLCLFYNVFLHLAGQGPGRERVQGDRVNRIPQRGLEDVRPKVDGFVVDMGWIWNWSEVMLHWLLSTIIQIGWKSPLEIC